jgi:hypothetical protein
MGRKHIHDHTNMLARCTRLLWVDELAIIMQNWGHNVNLALAYEILLNKLLTYGGCNLWRV